MEFLIYKSLHQHRQHHPDQEQDLERLLLQLLLLHLHLRHTLHKGMLQKIHLQILVQELLREYYLLLHKRSDLLCLLHLNLQQHQDKLD